jgi:hypothetical protein
VVTAPVAVALVAGISANRVRDRRQTGIVSRHFGAHATVGWLAAALAAVVWAGAFVMSWFPTPTFAVGMVLLIVVAAATSATVALTATSIVALQDAVATVTTWAPPITAAQLDLLPVPLARSQTMPSSFGFSVAGADPSAPLALAPRWKRIRHVALVGIAVGLASIIGPSYAANGVCGVVPCDSGGPEIGLRSSPDGRTVVGEIGRTAGSEVSALWVDDTDGNVSWRVERSEPAPFDGSFVVGQDIDGFSTVRSLDGPLPLDAYVNAGNGCGYSWAPLRRNLPMDHIVDSYGDEYSEAEFRQFDSGFGPCQASVNSSGKVFGIAGFGLFVSGVALLIVALTRPRTPAVGEVLIVPKFP